MRLTENKRYIIDENASNSVRWKQNNVRNVKVKIFYKQDIWVNHRTSSEHLLRNLYYEIKR